MELNAKEDDFFLDKENIFMISIALLLTTLTCYRNVPRPYKNLPVSGADYTLAILQGNPCRTVNVFWVTTSTFLFICDELLAVQHELVSKLLPMEEQLAIFLYIIGHNNSNQQGKLDGRAACTMPKYFKMHGYRILILNQCNLCPGTKYLGAILRYALSLTRASNCWQKVSFDISWS